MATLDELSKRKQKYFNVALNAAKLSDYGKFRHGAVLVKGGSIINIGYNTGGHSKFGSYHRCISLGDATDHAEINTVKCLPSNATKKAVLYVVRINKKEELRMSKPCAMCHSVLDSLGIKRVFYSTNTDTWDSYTL